MLPENIMQIIREQLQQGKTKQEIFHYIQSNYVVSVKELAKVLQGMVLPAKKQRYLLLNSILVGLVIFAMTLKIAILLLVQLTVNTKLFFLVYLFADIFLLYMLFRWTPQAQKAVALIYFLKVILFLHRIIIHNHELLVLVEYCTSIIIIVLAYFLNKKLYPPCKLIPKTQNDGTDKSLVYYDVVFKE